MDPIQPLLEKHMQCLEFDLFEQNKSVNEKPAGSKEEMSTAMDSRPRTCFTRESLWIGLKTL